MKIEDLKAGRVYRAKRPRVVHTLGGSYINDRQILSISPFEDTIQYDSPKVGFGSRYPVISVDKYMLAWSAVKGRYINSSVSNKKVNSAAIVECKGFKVRERQI